MTNEAKKFWDDAEIISTYTREQALDDGVLVDLSELGREAGFKFPVAMTNTAFFNYVEPTEELVDMGQSVEGRAWDVLNMLRFASRRGGSVLLFKVIFLMPKVRKGFKQQTVTLKAVCGPGDNMEPVLTIMLPEED